MYKEDSVFIPQRNMKAGVKSYNVEKVEISKYASLIVWVDWEDHSTLLYRPWFDHFAGWNSPTYFCPTAEISQSKFQVFHLPAQFLDPCKFYSSKSFSSPHLTQSNSSREPKHFASFYRFCRYYSLLQKEQSMGKKQQESDKISLLFITVWINSRVVHTSINTMYSY